jgi:hypothetical protein
MTTEVSGLKGADGKPIDPAKFAEYLVLDSVLQAMLKKPEYLKDEGEADNSTQVFGSAMTDIAQKISGIAQGFGK